MRKLILITIVLISGCIKKNKNEENIYSRPQIDLTELDYELEDDVLPEKEENKNEDNPEANTEPDSE